MSRYQWPQAPGADAVVPRGDDSRARRRHNGLRLTGLATEDAQRALRANVAAAAAAAPGTGVRTRVARAFGLVDDQLWQPLGPANLLSGQAAGSPRVSGRVRAIAVHPQGQRAYIASANGGVWATTDGGEHWVSVAGLAPTDTAGINRPAHRNACGALHVLWRDPPAGNELVFLGTGEVGANRAGRSGHMEGGVGVLVADKPLAGAANTDPWVREASNLVNDGIYRLAGDPAGTLVVAATLSGLYERPKAPASTVTWPLAAGTPFNTANQVVSDVLWTPGDPDDGSPAAQRRPARLWAWIDSGANNGLWVRDDGQVNFTQVTLDAANSAFGFTAARAVLAAAETSASAPTKVWLLVDGGVTPRLFRVSNPIASGGAPQALAVSGVPNILRGSGWYDIAIAVDPSDEDRVVMAGSYLGDPRLPAELDLTTTRDGAQRSYDASIVSDRVIADPTNAARLVYGTSAAASKMVGIGVHPDVHALVFSNLGFTLWAGCDGGVYRSDRPGSAAGFYSRNGGLAISETNYIAADPVFEGDMMCGLQDNGTIVRLSNNAWRVAVVGDGGGLVMDPTAPERWLAQYTNGTWSSSAGSWSAGPLFRGQAASGENGRAAFYSMPAVIRHTRGTAPNPVLPIAQFLVGTDRLWYTDNFGTNWVTLPTATDPLPAVIPAPPPLPAVAPLLDAAQDTLGEKVHACRWQDADTAWVLSETALHRYTRTPGSHEAGGAGTWARTTVLGKATPPTPTSPPAPAPRGKAKKRDPAPPSPATPPDPLAPLRKAGTWTEIEPNFIAAQGATPAAGALYMGTTGDPADTAVDTLWWFDGVAGAGSWHPTELRTKGANGQPLPAPVTALLVDPERADEVWVGTTVGVAMGVRSFVAAPAPGRWKWVWTMFVNGLPEAPVEDLSLFKDALSPGVTLRLLRAAIGSRGVWELRLDQAAVPALTYLRVHGGDLRHRVTAKLLRADGSTQRSWHASPDLRPRLAPSATLPAPAANVQRTAAGNAATLRRFQAALRKSTNDPRIAANGLWDAYFSEVLRDHGAPSTNVAAPPPPPGAPALPNQDQVFINKAFWELHATAANNVAEPWGTATPTEADLHDFTVALQEGTIGQAALQLAQKPWKVDIVVHQRGRAPKPGADVRVTLLWWRDPATKKRAVFNDPATWAPGNIPWAATVAAMLNSADGASAALPSGWHYAGSSNTTRRKTLAPQTLDALSPGVVTFDLALPTSPKLAVDTVIVLVAVLRAGPGDVAISTVPLRDLTLGSPHVAVRAVRIA
ncbi:MAG: hypothetical protein HZC37_28805 [Burkholderiales bacterium]|nr:hypothetical protein [Burkholderiales bacterium]